MKTMCVFLLCLVLGILTSCSAGKGDMDGLSLDNCPVIAENVGGMISCKYELATDTFDLALSALASGLEVIRLDDDLSDALVKEGRVDVSENYVGIYSAGSYKLFDKQGKYLRDISAIGQGPDEFFIAIYDSFIDEEANRVYLVSYSANKILAFDLEGNAQEHIPLAYSSPKAKIAIDNARKEVTVMVLPFPNTPSVVWKQDFKGNIIQEIPAGHFVVNPPDFSNEICSSQNAGLDFSLFLWAPKEDSLYYYDAAKNRLSPAFSLHSKRIRQHAYTDLPNYYLTMLYGKPEETIVGFQVNTTAYLLVDKNTLKGCYVNLKNDMLGGIPAGPDFSRGYYAVNMYPNELKEQLETALSKKDGLAPEMYKKVKELHDQITDDDNNILIIAKLRTDKNTTLSLATATNEPVQPTGGQTPPPPPPGKEETSDTTGYIYRFNEADMKQIRKTPQWGDVPNEPLTWFMANNKYKDWDKNDPKRVMVDFIVEKSGKTSNVTIVESSGIEALDKEAIRLVEKLKFKPGIDLKGNPVRCGDMKIDVFFPPKEPNK
jgi:TonB family protein